MKSRDLAALAGVSVRTLRHYHHVGVLPEPERAANGYRRYGVRDLVRLLRIRQLAALGVALEDVPAVLDAEQQDHADLLAELEDGVDAAIERLQERKRLIGALRARGAAPDLPPELARFAGLVTAPHVSAAMDRVDRESTLLLVHLLGEPAAHRLDAVHERLSEPGVRAEVVQVVDAFERLDGTADEEVVDAFVQSCLTRLAPLLPALQAPTGERSPDQARAEELLAAYHMDALNPIQRRALGRIGEHLHRQAAILEADSRP